ncbi:MAG: hypothetical protein A4E73_01371 [Syntrophaceae bacterium PtaU1.Bin231]|nr:MAG: hypothetical protein A4E73_01371 [Syntrophaceae bacterium PtaU1.Bin231]HOG17109.1 hypothetical protein [Syntrophales bacterium]HOI17497.1 hypothetical protein [Geobacteraceae bacterium]
MEYLPVGLFAVAAVGGLTLATMKFTGKGMPLALVLGHGIFAAAGLVALIARVLDDGNILMNVSLLLFLGVAAGGFLLLALDLKKKRQPGILIAAHGLGGAVSFVVLLISLFR